MAPFVFVGGKHEQHWNNEYKTLHSLIIADDCLMWMIWQININLQVASEKLREKWHFFTSYKFVFGSQCEFNS